MISSPKPRQGKMVPFDARCSGTTATSVVLANDRSEAGEEGKQLGR